MSLQNIPSHREYLSRCWVNVAWLRNAVRDSLMGTQFLIRLELESICSSWIGMRQLLPSERHSKETSYKAEREKEAQELCVS